MAINTQTTDMQNGVSCNKLHMTEMHLYQVQRQTVSEPMQMSMSLAYRKYGETGDNITVHQEARTISIDDYMAEATAKAMMGDMRMADAMAAIEAAVAVIIEDAGIEGVCEVMA